MYLQCWGEGSPTIVIASGGGEIREIREPAASFLSHLADERRVCVYDRASHGRSDPAPDGPRQLEDVTDDLHALLEAAGVDGPQILVGPSFGGGLAMVYAHRFPDDVRGVVLFDVSKPEAVTVEEEPELAWDHPANAEHLDVINGFAPRLTREQFPIIAPLLVVTATDGESSVDDQAFWLDWSPSSRQIEIPGEHDFYEDHPVEAADAILSMGE
jgi:pimeloyl-ACP methyl ester carboxylesterase